MAGGDVPELGAEGDLAGMSSVWSRKNTTFHVCSAARITDVSWSVSGADRSTPVINAPVQPDCGKTCTSVSVAAVIVVTPLESYCRTPEFDVNG